MSSAALRPYILHLRPKSWPTVGLHMIAGAFIAIGPGALGPIAFLRALAACAVWTILLNGGTLALNSAYDRDDGDVGFLKKPPPPPPGLAAYGFALMVLGLAPAWFLGRGFFLVYLVSVPMSWAYSAKPLRLKARGGWDVVVNMVGYGALTPLAGWLAVAPAPTPRQALICAGFGFLFGSMYPMTQFYQMEEDLRKGARTLAIRLGVRGSMLFICATLVAANLCWFAAASARPVPIALCGWAVLALQGALWAGLTALWWVRYDAFPHERGFYIAMATWAISNLALIAAFGWAP